MEQTGTAKVFFDVFPTLKAEESMRMLFSDVEVKKITTNSARDFLHIYILSRHLLQKKQIWQMERRIKEQLFGTSPVSIRIEEEYALSEQYTPEALMAEYRDSIIVELKGSSVLAANMFEQAGIRFEDGNICCLELADTIVSEGRREQIVNLLDDIFNRRCKIKTEIRVTYREKKESKTREFDEQRIQREINAIFQRNKSAHGNGHAGDTGAETGMEGADQAMPWDEAQGNTGGNPSAVAAGRPGAGDGGKETGSRSAKRQNGKTQGRIQSQGADRSTAGKAPDKGYASFGKGRQGRSGFRKDSGKDYVRPLKQGDAPNLIYGRDFGDEPFRLTRLPRRWVRSPCAARSSVLRRARSVMRERSSYFL